MKIVVDLLCSYSETLFIDESFKVRLMVIFKTIQLHSELSSQTSARAEDCPQLPLVVTTVVRIMTVKLHWSAVFNAGPCRTQATTE